MIDLNKFDSKLQELLIYVAKSQNHIKGIDWYKIAAIFLENEFAKKGHSIVLHGAGEHTVRILKHASPILKNSICAITDNAKAGTLIDRFTVSTTEILQNITYNFVVMSSDINQTTMLHELHSIGIERNIIIDLYADCKLDKQLFNTKFEQDRVGLLLEKLETSSNPLLVIGNSIAPSNLKLFKYLNKHFDLFVITPDHSVCGIKIDTTQEEFSRFYQFDYSIDLLLLASQISKAKIITLNGIFRNSLGAAITILANVDTFAMFYDIIGTTFNDDKILSEVCNIDIELFSEKIMWENSTGVVFKEALELAMPNIQKYKPKKYLQFFDYCDDDIVLQDKTIEDKISFVYAGGLVSTDAKDHAAHLQISIVDVANVLVNNNCSFSIFNAYDNGNDSGFDMYKNMIDSDLFSYSKVVPRSHLHTTLCKYDVGVILFDFARVLDKYSFDYFKFGSSTKIISYIEAELPIVVSKEAEVMASIVEENNIGVALYWHELDKLPHIFTPEKIREYKNNIRKFKKSLSYSQNIHKFVDFINE